MTREEAISFLQSRIDLIDKYYPQIEDYREALDMAIQALEHPEKNVIAVVPCGDAISREDTLKAMIEQVGVSDECYLYPVEANLYKVVKNMPSVTPQPYKAESDEGL